MRAAVPSVFAEGKTPLVEVSNPSDPHQSIVRIGKANWLAPMEQ
jgi:hypothetical protein